MSKSSARGPAAAPRSPARTVRAVGHIDTAASPTRGGVPAPLPRGGSRTREQIEREALAAVGASDAPALPDATASMAEPAADASDTPKED